MCEHAGLPRAAGRLLGWLLVADPPEQSAAGLRAALGASAGSVSTTARLLIDLGLVERIKVAGDRRAYYRMRPGGWTQFLRERTATVRATRDVAAQGLALLADTPEARRRRLREMHDLYAWWEREALALLERWTRQGTG